MGTPKGLLQVLWERRFMDTSKDVCTYYTVSRRQNNYGNTIIETSLRELMRNCLKFIEQETLLQTNAFKMGECRDHIIVDRTPKCHPNLSSEGIEYSWGCSINSHR